MARLERDLSFNVPTMACEVSSFVEKSGKSGQKTTATNVPAAMAIAAINAN
jgi:hypothetical protein